MLNDLRISIGSMREIGEQQRGQVIISSIMSVANGLLPAIVAKYRDSRPGIEIILREGVHGTVLEDIRSGTADLGATWPMRRRYMQALTEGTRSCATTRAPFFCSIHAALWI